MWARLSLTEALGDLSFHIVPFDELGATFVELLRSPCQLVIPCLVDQRLVVTFFEAAPQIIGNLPKKYPRTGIRSFGDSTKCSTDGHSGR